MTVLAYTIGFNALMWMNIDAFRLIKIYSENSDDSATFRASPISIAANTAELWKEKL